MKNSNPIPEELIAPCGMNCALCSRYLAFVNKLKRSQCIGCRIRAVRRVNQRIGVLKTIKYLHENILNMYT